MLCRLTPRGRLASGIVLSFLAMAATGFAADEDKKFSDEKFSFSLTVPAPWAEAPLAAYTVPGTTRGAWSGPSGSSIVAFVQEPGQAISPRILVDASAAAMKDKLGCKVDAAEVKTVGGKKAMWLVATGKGTGGALTGQGDVETTTHWVAIPREKDVVVVLLTCPAADYADRLPSFEKAIKSLVIGGAQSAEQSEAK